MAQLDALEPAESALTPVENDAMTMAGNPDAKVDIVMPDEKGGVVQQTTSGMGRRTFFIVAGTTIATAVLPDQVDGARMDALSKEISDGGKVIPPALNEKEHVIYGPKSVVPAMSLDQESVTLNNYMQPKRGGRKTVFVPMPANVGLQHNLGGEITIIDRKTGRAVEPQKVEALLATHKRFPKYANPVGVVSFDAQVGHVYQISGTYDLLLPNLDPTQSAELVRCARFDQLNALAQANRIPDRATYNEWQTLKRTITQEQYRNYQQAQQSYAAGQANLQRITPAATRIGNAASTGGPDCGDRAAKGASSSRNVDATKGFYLDHGRETSHNHAWLIATDAAGRTFFIDPNLDAYGRPNVDVRGQENMIITMVDPGSDDDYRVAGYGNLKNNYHRGRAVGTQKDELLPHDRYGHRTEIVRNGASGRLDANQEALATEFEKLAST